ncbi:hypothetical protein QDR37_03450 [Amnibacterium sp. CER49]|uniref:hypothetical protein n=1 Tax=Amnibacterium sp. CER49 TaxID=3039161 RepID=UPI00244BDDB3|nr:hypothetical protein [Amnibacterium sp. CER49]MDH2442995.1 hypothetical protein [Amnibacterium sp. CER49]
MTTLLHRVVVPPAAAAEPAAPAVPRRATLTERALPVVLAVFTLPFALLWRSDRD